MNQSLVRTKRTISFYKEKEISKTESISILQRRAETRTKIQLGGLLIKSGLAERFSIIPGEDLQLDEEAREKGTLLLGALIDFNETISSDTPPLSQKEEWLHLGRSAFMKHFLNKR